MEIDRRLLGGAIMGGVTMLPTPPANANLCVQASNEGFKRVLYRALARG